MKMEISSGSYHGGVITLIDVVNKPFQHAYYLQVTDKEGNELLPNEKVMINKDDLQRIARAVDKYKY